MTVRLTIFLFFLFCWSECTVFCFLKPLKVLQKFSTATIIAISLPLSHPFVSPTAAVDLETNDLRRLKVGLKNVNNLIDNWIDKTTYCNFGEVQRKMMEAGEKELLLKNAAEGGLLDYDKSKTMDVLCKRDPQIVRAYLGLEPSTGNTVLYKAEKLMKNSIATDKVDPDMIDSYFEAIERYSEAIAAADSLAYAARTDYGSQQSQSRAEAEKAGLRDGKEDFLQQSKAQVIKVRDALTEIVQDLQL